MENSQEKSPREKVMCGVSGPTFQEEVGNGPRAEVPGMLCQVKVNRLL